MAPLKTGCPDDSISNQKFQAEAFQLTFLPRQNL